MHPMTPWAEVLRAEDRRTRERALLLRYPLWAIKADLEDEPLALTFDNAVQHGLSAPDQLVADDWDACQAFADDLRANDIRAFTAPSAALPGTRNLVVLDPAVATSYEAEPIGREDFPLAVAAQDGRCPEDLWHLVHYRGARTPHAAYQAWSDGNEFLFEEPTVTAAGLSLG